MPFTASMLTGILDMRMPMPSEGQSLRKLNMYMPDIPPGKSDRMKCCHKVVFKERCTGYDVWTQVQWHTLFPKRNAFLSGSMYVSPFRVRIPRSTGKTAVFHHLWLAQSCRFWKMFQQGWVSINYSKMHSACHQKSSLNLMSHVKKPEIFMSAGNVPGPSLNSVHCYGHIFPYSVTSFLQQKWQAIRKDSFNPNHVPGLSQLNSQ